MEKLQAHYLQEQNRPAAARVALLLADTYPYREALQLTAGGLSLEAGQPGEAVRLLRRALRHDPGEPEKYLAVLVRACRALDDAPCVQRNRERLREFDPGNPEARGVSGEPAAAEQ
ncbi:MAG: tetratricopeptide repeat protein [Gammaproteobacteria bacterium]|jgi:predicted Zn-dependent protease